MCTCYKGYGQLETFTLGTVRKDDGEEGNEKGPAVQLKRLNKGYCIDESGTALDALVVPRKKTASVRSAARSRQS